MISRFFAPYSVKLDSTMSCIRAIRSSRCMSRPVVMMDTRMTVRTCTRNTCKVTITTRRPYYLLFRALQRETRLNHVLYQRNQIIALHESPCGDDGHTQDSPNVHKEHMQSDYHLQAA